MKIFIIIFDSLRKDHSGKTYGNNWIQTPNIDAFANDCIVFDKAYPESLPTLPVRRAIHTGIRTFPFNHKKPKLRNIEGLDPAGWNPIPPNQTHLAEYMLNAGYITSFVTSTYHHFQPNMNYHLAFHEWHWIRGQEYDRYRALERGQRNLFNAKLKNHVPAKTKENRAAIQYLKNVLKWYLPNIQDRNEEIEYFPAQTFNTALKSVEDTLNIKNTLILIDSFDPHEPWDPPEKYLNLYSDKNYSGNKIIHPVYNENKNFFSDDEIKFMRASYAGEVSLCDNWFGFFINKLKEMEIYEDSLIILLSDHGHCIGDHGAFGKIPMCMYPELVDIPFMIKPLGVTKGSKRIKKSYAYVHDILPTIFGFLGKAKPEVFEGLDLSIFIDESDLVLENRDYITCGFSDCSLYKDDHYALITSNNRNNQKLFDLSKDPEWNEDISGDNPDICKELFKIIEVDAKNDLLITLDKTSFDRHSDWYYKKEADKKMKY